MLSHQRSESCRENDSESDLYLALVRQELLLHYQPVVDLKTGQMIGAEALLRWRHPTRGILPAAQFLSSVTEGSTLSSIEEWILHQVCRQAKKWQDAEVAPFVVSVNLSAFPLLPEQLVQAVADALQESGLAANYLELEMTEKMAMDGERAMELLFQLKQLGVSISMDDFGRGFSSLHYLKRFPIDKLKIDQSFIQGCMEDDHEQSVVRTIIGMAKNLRLQVVAEGVETPEQLVFLQQNLCDAAQGYLIGKPADAEELIAGLVHVQQVVQLYGIGLEQTALLYQQELLAQVRLELSETLKNQQGMTFKFVKQGQRYIHTLCEGGLMHKMGLESEQIVGKELHEFLPLEVAERKKQSYDRAWAGEEDVNYEGYHNGVHYLAALRPIFQSGKVKEVIASCIDITQLKKAEEALQTSEAKYRLIAENMSDVIVVLEQSGIISYVSPAAVTVMGVPPEEIQDKHMMHFILPKEQERVNQAIQQLIERKQPQQLTFSGVHANGSKLMLEAKGSPVLDRRGDVQQIILVIRNITAQVHAEQFLRKIDKLSLVGHLAAGVAHEIRNPVTSIKGFVQLLMKEHGKQEYFDIMLAEFQQLENILREFVFLTGQRPPQFEQVAVGEILASVAASVQAMSPLYDLQLDMTGTEELEIWCDPSQIRQLFLNLLSNAVEAMPDGGRILVQMLPEGHEQVKIRIVDEGCGMTEERLKHVGEPFYSTKEKGTGLGLMISYKIIEYHNGYVHFSSEPGQGTTVEVVFPLSKVRSVI